MYTYENITYISSYNSMLQTTFVEKIKTHIIRSINFFQWLWWSTGSMLAFSNQVNGFKPDQSHRMFKDEKILSTPSFGREVKLSVQCRRFAACKRSLNGAEVVISAKLPDDILAHSSHFRRWDLSRRGGRGGTWW